MKKIVQRFRAKTPLLFRRVRNVSLAISGASTAAAVFYSQLPVEMVSFVPAWFIKAFAITGIATAFLAQLTKVDASV
ncbi:hypothetical protein [Williamwhitmania taraxaci]|uniref:Uncharacterized protein n=1 Tax=Williamwhitmania taraxaci TaxID=1640674 RepID=A0A1G6MBP1_9BACT|nr:hypothetical protein [Williamwhitmania taraxaci]SDC52396.1 hypothetical protein SAMN05216323_103515 [Williamwhitmania taraxaci]